MEKGDVDLLLATWITLVEITYALYTNLIQFIPQNISKQRVESAHCSPPSSGFSLIWLPNAVGDGVSWGLPLKCSKVAPICSAGGSRTTPVELNWMLSWWQVLTHLAPKKWSRQRQEIAATQRVKRLFIGFRNCFGGRRAYPSELGFARASAAGDEVIAHQLAAPERFLASNGCKVPKNPSTSAPKSIDT